VPDWLVAGLVPTSLFSLRLPIATATAAKSCLAPTRYALKLALVDAEIRIAGPDRGKELFKVLKGREVRIELPERLAVTNALVKIAVPYERKVKAAEEAGKVDEAKRQDQYPFKTSVAFREYVHFGGSLRIAWSAENLAPAEEAWLRGAWARLSWIGKRGSFVAPLPDWQRLGDLPNSFDFPLANPPAAFPVDVVVQAHDDLGVGAEFERVSTYSNESLRPGVDRVPALIAFPLRLDRRGRGFTSYIRSV